eukprot:TRINITY_DN410_c1_g1_i4.p1 TRINITY_DN410_c1_g1~~TRINITY_DN410_c1_g1_i4.p1  ORF type:complete len:159 (-),score=62.98 TRINITY_DN410_c1_g1_i4:88-528(-)
MVDTSKADLARKIFTSIDNSGSGFIDKITLRKLFTFSGHNVSDEKTEEIYKALDKNSDGKIDVEEFIKMDVELDGYEKVDKLDSAKAFFELVDIDKDGFITIDEYTYFLTAMGENFAEIRQSYNNADSSKDGKISFSEFVNHFESD